jgi:protein-export membrane protein SecD
MDSRQWNYVSIGAVVVLCIVAALLFWPPSTQIKQGLDLQGGLSVILTAQKANVLQTDMDRAMLIVQMRVNGLGVSEATVQREGASSILVQLPGVRDAEQALKMLGSTGQLEFVDWDSIPTTQATAWDKYMGALESNTATDAPASLKQGSYAVLLTGDVITNAAAEPDSQSPGFYAVSMQFDASGTATWKTVTTEYAATKRRVAIVLDGQVVSAPRIDEPIPSGSSQISGQFPAAQAKRLATVLQTGALPVTLVPQNTQEVGPTLGQNSLRQGLLAVVAGLLLVAIYLGVYYRGLGVLSWISLAAFATIYLGVLAAMSRAGVFALSLPGIAGLVLSIGMAADTSILIFERLREEVRMGKTPRSAAKSGTKHALLTSIDADVVTFVSAIFLYAIAIGPVRGFALTLILGLVIDLTVGILFTRPMVMILAETLMAKAPAFWGLKGGGSDA